MRFDFGLTDSFGAHYLAQGYRKNEGAAKSGNAGFAEIAAAKAAGTFSQSGFDRVNSSSADRTEQYVEYLKQRYGANVMVKNVGNDQKSVDSFGASIAGFNNVVIAPNILEQMANDPEKAAYYERQIKKALDDFPKIQAELSLMGHELHSYAVGIDEHGVVHKYLTGDLKPEVRAKIEARIKAEQAAKRARREKYHKLSEEAAERRRELAEWQYHKMLMAEAFRQSGFDLANYHFISQPQMSYAMAAYMGAAGMAIGNIL